MSDLRNMGRYYLVDDLKRDFLWSGRTTKTVKKICGEKTSIDKLLYIVVDDFLTMQGVGIRSWKEFEESLNTYRSLKQKDDPDYIAPFTKAQQKAILDAADSFLLRFKVSKCKKCEHHAVIRQRDSCIRHPKSVAITHGLGCGEYKASEISLEFILKKLIKRSLQKLFDETPANQT